MKAFQNELLNLKQIKIRYKNKIKFFKIKIICYQILLIQKTNLKINKIVKLAIKIRKFKILISKIK